jgi:hypothetical protein
VRAAVTPRELGLDVERRKWLTELARQVHVRRWPRGNAQDVIAIATRGREGDHDVQTSAVDDHLAGRDEVLGQPGLQIPRPCLDLVDAPHEEPRPDLVAAVADVIESFVDQTGVLHGEPGLERFVGFKCVLRRPMWSVGSCDEVDGLVHGCDRILTMCGAGQCAAESPEQLRAPVIACWQQLERDADMGGSLVERTGLLGVVSGHERRLHAALGAGEAGAAQVVRGDLGGATRVESIRSGSRRVFECDRGSAMEPHHA